MGFANYAKPLHPFGGLYSDAFNTPLGLMDPFVYTSQGMPSSLMSIMAIGSARSGMQVQGMGAMGREGSVYGQPFGQTTSLFVRYALTRVAAGHPRPLVSAYSHLL